MKNTNDVLTVGVFQEILEKFEGRVDKKIDDLRGEMQQEFGKVRSEMAHGFDEVRQEFKNVRIETTRGFDKMRDDIIDVIDQNIQPQLTSHAHRIARLERKIA